MADSAITTNPSSRRGFLRGLAGLPMIGGGVAIIGSPTAAAVPVNEMADPVLAAINKHRAAWQAFDDAVAANDEREITEAERVTGDAEDDAWAVLLHQPCATLEAARVKAEYLLNCPRAKGCAWEDWHVQLILGALLEVAA